MTEDKKPNLEFIGKILINSDIQLRTALHIGGTEEGFDIGGIDNTVIKDAMTGVPYIPGSSLRGKMRSMLEWAYGEGKLCSDPTHPIGIVFGVAADSQKGVQSGPTRLTVRDAYPDDNQVKNWANVMGENIYTEVKTENYIDRLTSAANPRSMERVPAGSIFKAQFVYDVFNKADVNHLKLLFEGMQLLEDSYLGGGGTRGSGQVEFINIKIEARNKSFYIGIEEEPVLTVHQERNTRPKEILEKFTKIFLMPEG